MGTVHQGIEHRNSAQHRNDATAALAGNSEGAALKVPQLTVKGPGALGEDEDTSLHALFRV